MYNLREVFEIAEQIERNGAKFYRKAAATFGNMLAGALLKQLADWEDEHEIIFNRLKHELVDTQGGKELYDPEGEAVAYLTAIADGEVFKIKEDPTQLLTGTESLTEIFHIALRCERDSITYYLGLKNLVGETSGKEQVERIIQEEMGHICLINTKMMELRK